MLPWARSDWKPIRPGVFFTSDLALDSAITTHGVATAALVKRGSRQSGA